MTTPRISILIPVYNGSRTITETIDSVFKSTYTNFEVLLINDGSTDDSGKICEELAKTHSQIRFFNHTVNRGLSGTLNFGVSEAKGEYIARINQDDVMTPDRLEKQLDFLTAHPEVVCVGGAIELFTDSGKIVDLVRFPLTDKELKAKWLYLSPFSDPTVMYRTETVKKTEGYTQKFWPVDDVHMWYQLGTIGKLANLKDIVTKVRWHEEAGSIKSHRTQMNKLYELHLWAATHIEKPSLFVRTFWFSQYMAGIIFPPKFNWFIYRILKKFK